MIDDSILELRDLVPILAYVLFKSVYIHMHTSDRYRQVLIGNKVYLFSRHPG